MVLQLEIFHVITSFFLKFVVYQNDIMSKDNRSFNNILELIGNTPLIKLNKVTKNFPGSYFTKYEAFNPGHSNKDRIALHILNQAEKKGLLKNGSTIIETTSGNTGFSVAMVSLLKGYKCILAVS